MKEGAQKIILLGLVHNKEVVVAITRTHCYDNSIAFKQIKLLKTWLTGPLAPALLVLFWNND